MKMSINLFPTSKASHTILMGDFNAKVGRGNTTESSTSSYTAVVKKTNRGDTLVNFAEHHQLKIMNTLFKKRPNKRWTWISPNGTTKNEIDFFLTNRPRTVTDASVINRLNTRVHVTTKWSERLLPSTLSYRGQSSSNDTRSQTSSV